MTDVAMRVEPTVQSAAAPSPFPPIADYAFLSNCHTGALVAPDGAIDWLCAPAFSHLALMEAAARIIVPELLALS